MLIIGLYHPLSFRYDEGDLIDTVIDRCDTFIDMHPNGVVVCGGDLNRLDLDCLSTSSGLVPIGIWPLEGLPSWITTSQTTLSCSTTPRLSSTEKY